MWPSLAIIAAAHADPDRCYVRSTSTMQRTNGNPMAKTKRTKKGAMSKIVGF